MFREPSDAVIPYMLPFVVFVFAIVLTVPQAAGSWALVEITVLTEKEGPVTLLLYVPVTHSLLAESSVMLAYWYVSDLEVPVSAIPALPQLIDVDVKIPFWTKISFELV